MIDLKQVLNYKEAVFCSTDGNYLNIINGTMKNKFYKFNQDYEIVFSEVDNFYYITNFDLMDSDTKFYKFQDSHTYKHFKVAFRNFVKLVNS